MLKVCVVIPTYGVEGFVRSFFESTLDDILFVIVDNSINRVRLPYYWMF